MGKRRAIIDFLRGNRFLKTVIQRLSEQRAKELIRRVEHYLSRDDRIIDVGSGTCSICKILRDMGYSVLPLDIYNFSFYGDIKPVVYDGKSMPFQNNRFDKALVITVLHHVNSPDSLLKEIKRISRKIVIIEDICVGKLHKMITFLFDSLLNLEFTKHPHSNRTDAEWKNSFAKLGLRLLDAKYESSLVVFRHSIYYLDKSSG